MVIREVLDGRGGNLESSFIRCWVLIRWALTS